MRRAAAVLAALALFWVGWGARSSIISTPRRAALAAGPTIYFDYASNGRARTNTLYPPTTLPGDRVVTVQGQDYPPPTEPPTTLPPAPTTTVAPNPPPSPTTQPGPTPTTTIPPPAGLAFDDEFNGTSVDLSKWELGWFGGSKPVNGSETACYSPQQTSESGGFLHLTAVSSTSCGKSYATGFVDTRTSFTFTTGTLTFRAYLPGDSGGVWNWPALWTDGTGTWPATGESDVMEGLSGRATCTYHSPSGGQGCNANGGFGWHTYAEQVTPGKVVYSYDGNVVGTVTNSTVGYHPHFIIMSEQMGSLGGPVRVPADLQVDWVRVVKTS